MPQDDSWGIARSTKEAKEWVLLNGIPNEISFDHDLGSDDISIDFIHWMIGKVLDKELELPKDFKYHVHSSNPVGRKNIISLMRSFLAFIKMPT